MEELLKMEQEQLERQKEFMKYLYHAYKQLLLQDLRYDVLMEYNKAIGLCLNAFKKDAIIRNPLTDEDQTPTQFMKFLCVKLIKDNTLTEKED